MIGKNSDIYINLNYKYYNANEHIEFPNREDYVYYYVYQKGKLIIEGSKDTILQADIFATLVYTYCGGDSIQALQSKGYTIEKDLGGDQYKEAIKRFRECQQELDKEFKQDALKVVGLTDHTKADKIFQYCDREGHSEGYREILCILENISDLFLDD